MNAGEIGAALGARQTRGIYTAACPACGYKAALTISEKDERTLVHCHVGCENDAVLDALRTRGLWGGRRQEFVPRAAKVAKVAKVRDSQAAAVDLWRQTTDDVTLIKTYFGSRSITLDPPPTLRALAAALHSPTGLRFPAMVGGVTIWPSRAVTAVHRTFLKQDGSGKAPVSNDKMTLGPVGGGAVRLAPAAYVLGVAEGIETGLSAMQATAIPVWAALSAGGIEMLRLPDPPLAEEVVIFADHDPRGQRAAEVAAAKWHAQGRRVRIALPPQPGSDFNDLLRGDRAGDSHVC